MRFYEVHAKSVLNRVPEKSRMPFRWTINPYRGCSHACRYCLDPTTRILLADGTTRTLSDLEVGERIYGTVREGAYRRLRHTTVLAKWSTIKPAYRIVLADGTQLIASGDHRFLTTRGWKYVTGAEQGPEQRPHLTLNSKLMGVAAFAEPPLRTSDYRRGYLCGLIRGDGHLGSYSYASSDGRRRDVHRFRLALTDDEALVRADTYLRTFGVDTKRFEFSPPQGNRRAMSAIRTSTRSGVAETRRIVRWPEALSEEWERGFLAGIFDAEGSCGIQGILRISNTDPDILGWTLASLERFRFDVAIEDPGRKNDLLCLRVRGGLAENLRFFHTAEPAITRKRSLEGRAVKTRARLHVTAIEPLGGTRELVDITTGTGDFIANGVVSHNCFARPTHTYLNFNAGRDFEREIVVKVNAPEVLRAELARRSWKREHVALGTNTDPYQWVEKRYRLMVGIWEALRDANNPCSVLTKSPLLLRDLDLMLEIAARTSFSACLSIPTLDEKAWRETEPHTPHPKARLEAVAELNRAGIPTGVLVAPLMPGINDSPRQIEPLLEKAHEAGATNINGIALHLRGEVRQVFMDWLKDSRPELVERYRDLYKRGAYAPAQERERLSGLVRRKGKSSAFRLSGHGAADATPKAKEPEPQPTLF